jgi:signal transduction histidine kinase
MSEPTDDQLVDDRAVTRRRWPLILAAGLPVGLISGTFSYLLQRWAFPSATSQPAGQYGWIILYNILSWTAWLAFVPLVWWLAGRVRVTRERWLATGAFHALAGLCIAAAHCLVAASIQYTLMTISGTSPGRQPFTWTFAVKRVFLFNFEWEVLLYWGLVGVSHAAHFYGELKARELRESRLQTSLVEARLESLQRQLQPHFLFNTLHAIAGLLHKDVDAAEAMIVRLGDLLRAVFQSDVQQEVPLGRELALARQYVDLQRLRFGTTLRCEFDVPAQVEAAKVPVLILQPLLENALKHGLRRQSDDGLIHVGARRIGERLEIEVADNGQGVSAGALRELNEGVGLSNTRARLAHLYPEAHTVTFSTPPAGGFLITIGLPYRLDSPAILSLDRPA